MHLFQAEKDVGGNVPNHAVLKCITCPLGRIYNSLQASFGCQVHQEVQVVFVLEGLVQANHLFDIFQLAHDVPLREHLVRTESLQGELDNFFKSVVLFCVFLLNHVNDTVGALTQFFLYCEMFFAQSLG